MGSVGGRWIDDYPGVRGYLCSCLVLCVVSTVGLTTAVAVMRGALRRAGVEATAA